MIQNQDSTWNKVLAIEIAYSVSKHQLNFELLLLIPDIYIDTVFKRLVHKAHTEEGE